MHILNSDTRSKNRRKDLERRYRYHSQEEEEIHNDATIIRKDMGGVGISITGQKTGSEVDDYLGFHQGQFFPSMLDWHRNST